VASGGVDPLSNIRQVPYLKLGPSTRASNISFTLRLENVPTVHDPIIARISKPSGSLGERNHLEVVHHPSCADSSI